MAKNLNLKQNLYELFSNFAADQNKPDNNDQYTIFCSNHHEKLQKDFQNRAKEFFE